MVDYFQRVVFHHYQMKVVEMRMLVEMLCYWVAENHQTDMVLVEVLTLTKSRKTRTCSPTVVVITGSNSKQIFFFN